MQLDSLAYGDVDIQSNPIPTDERGWHDVMAAVRPLSLSNCLLIPATTAQCRQPFGSCHQTQDPHGRRTLYIQTISNQAARSNKKKKKGFFFFSFFLSCCSTRKTAWCPARVIPTKPPSPPAGLEKHPRCLLGPSLRCCTGSSFYGLLQQVLCLYPTRFDRRKRGDKPASPFC